MRNEEWIAFLRRVPVEKHNILAVMTKGGRELNIANIFRLDPAYMVCRARSAGSTDEATVMVIPYDQIDMMGFREQMKEEQVNEMLGPVVETSTAAPPAVSPPRAPTPQPAPASVPPAVPDGTVTMPAMPGKAALLERLRRARAGQDPGAGG
jgi:hypothetical protein